MDKTSYSQVGPDATGIRDDLSCCLNLTIELRSLKNSFGFRLLEMTDFLSTSQACCARLRGKGEQFSSRFAVPQCSAGGIIFIAGREKSTITCWPRPIDTVRVSSTACLSLPQRTRIS